MIKAVFFDWFNTLAHYEPSREELESQALRECGIDVPPSKLVPALSSADKYYFAENAISPVRTRSPEEQAGIYTHYQQMVLAEAGVNTSAQPGQLVQIMKRTRELSQGMRFALFSDVLPNLKKLKERKLVLGLLTNLDRDVKPICHEVGLEPYLDVIVTSADVGSDKPNPPIFLAALEQAGVNASEAIHVGDQYQSDILGARGVGISPVLLDRFGLCRDITDCPRIQNLSELTNFLK